jgi:hypothetical protein
MKMRYKSVTQILYHEKRVVYQIPLSTTHAVYYGVLKIHETNTPFPVTRHQFRMMVDKDVLQHFFEDLNYAKVPLKNSYHHISSVAVGSATVLSTSGLKVCSFPFLLS